MSKWLDKFLNEDSQKQPDKPDKPREEGHLSVLSGPSEESFSKSSLLEDFEERLAIAEYDGQQNDLQAQCIAYQDAFVAVLRVLP